MIRKNAIIVLAASLGLFLYNNSFAEGANISVDVSSAALQLTVPENINLELEPTSSTAAFGSALLTFNVATNNITGYTVTMSVPQTAMLHSAIATATLPTLESSVSELSFPANHWGYKTTDDYKPIKLNNTDSTWNLDGPTNGQNHSLTLAAKADGSLIAGSYTNTLTFHAVANPNSPKQTIIFNGNGANGGGMNSISVFSGETVELPLNGFSKTGYYFNGWNEKADNNGAGYGDGDSYAAPTLTAPQTKTLYAQWVADSGQGTSYVGRSLQAAFEQAYVYNTGQFPKDEGGYKHGLYVPEKDPSTGEYTGNYFEATKQSDYEGIPANDLRFAIQDISLLVGNENVCERTTVIGSSAYVLDLRDFTSYHITKLKDGNCWLTDNLALDPTLPAVKAKLSESNTNASTAAITNFLIGGNPDGNAGWSTSPVSYETSSSVYNQPRVNAASKDIIPQGSDQLASYAFAGKWKVGVYYNYCAASIGTYCYANGGVDKPDTAYDIDYDICPAGWRMPMASEYRTLAGVIGYHTNFNAYTSICSNPDYTDFRNAFRLPMSGRFNNGSAQYQGSYGGAWAATYSASRYMNAITVNNASTYSGAGVTPLSSSTANYGYSVRCIAK